jgi:hypothetical protein
MDQWFNVGAIHHSRRPTIKSAKERLDVTDRDPAGRGGEDSTQWRNGTCSRNAVQCRRLSGDLSVRDLGADGLRAALQVVGRPLHESTCSALSTLSEGDPRSETNVPRSLSFETASHDGRRQTRATRLRDPDIGQALCRPRAPTGGASPSAPSDFGR